MERAQEGFGTLGAELPPAIQENLLEAVYLLGGAASTVPVDETVNVIGGSASTADHGDGVDSSSNESSEIDEDEFMELLGRKVLESSSTKEDDELFFQFCRYYTVKYDIHPEHVGA